MNSTEALGEFAYNHTEPKVTCNSYGEPDISPDKDKIDSLLSDLTALISEHYTEKSRYDELLRQRDELKEALVDMVWQFAYTSSKGYHTGGLSALEGAFSALGLSDPITILDFEAAIKSTENSSGKPNNSEGGEG